MNLTLFILAGTAFLSFITLAAFVLVVVSIHRNERARLSETKGNCAGIIARKVLTGVRTECEEDTE
jgi:hypothetical protein